MKKLGLGLAVGIALAGLAPLEPARADNIAYPAYVPYPFKRSHVTRRIVRIIPYRHVFRVRVFTTPQLPPYYNVPAYPVISPF